MKRYLKYLLILRYRIMIHFWKFPKIMNWNETIDYIVNNKVSISRYGDGEIAWLSGSSGVDFQRKDFSLALRLREVLSSELDGHLTCVPKIITDTSELNEKSKFFWESNTGHWGGTWKKYMRRNFYGDANISRPLLGWKDLNFSRLEKTKEIWKNRDVVIVEGEESFWGVGNDLLDDVVSLERIIVPAKNAWDIYDKIKKSITEKIKDRKIETLVLLAIGPTATILAYDLTKEKIQAIDIGHLSFEYNEYLKQNQRKLKKIKSMEQYNSEIVLRVKN